MLEFTTGVVGGESPVYGGYRLITFIFKSSDFRFESLLTWKPPIKTLSAEYTQLNLSHVEPTTVFGRAVKLQALGDASRFRRLERVVQFVPPILARIPGLFSPNNCLGVSSKQTTGR